MVYVEYSCWSKEIINIFKNSVSSDNNHSNTNSSFFFRRHKFSCIIHSNTDPTKDLHQNSLDSTFLSAQPVAQNTNRGLQPLIIPMCAIGTILPSHRHLRQWLDLLVPYPRAHVGRAASFSLPMHIHDIYVTTPFLLPSLLLQCFIFFLHHVTNHP